MHFVLQSAEIKPKQSQLAIPLSQVSLFEEVWANTRGSSITQKDSVTTPELLYVYAGEREMGNEG